MAHGAGTTGSGGGLARRIRAVRPFSFPLSALPVLVSAAAVGRPGQWRWELLAASFVGVLLLHAAGNLLNDYFDFHSGVDRRLAADHGRPGRLLLRGEHAPRQVLRQAVGSLLLGGVHVAYLTLQRGWVVAALAAAAGLGLYAYTGPPFRMKYRGLGEPLVFALFGPALMGGAAFVQTGAFEGSVLILSIPVGCATTAVLVGNHLRDRQEDRAAGIRTIARLAGGRLAAWVYVLLLLGATVGLAGLALAGLAPRALLAAPAALAFAARPIACVCRGRRLADIDARTARFATVLLVGVLLSLLLRG